MHITEITDKFEWENFIETHSPQSFFQSWDWGEITKKSNDKKVKFLNRFGVYDKNQLVALFQLTKIYARRGSYLHLRHGPVFSVFNLPNLQFISEYLKNLAKVEKTSFIRISPLLSNTGEFIQAFKKVGYKNSPIHRLDGEYCWVLDLDKNENELLNSMRKTTRYLIRWAIKNNVQINKSTDLNAINRFLKLYEITAKRHHFVKHQGIKEEFEILLKEKRIILFEGFHKKKLLSSALIIFYGNQAIYHHSASIEQKIPVNYLLQWEAILEAKKKGCKVYNFWGIAPPDDKKHPWYNLTQFKIGFGGRIVEYLHSMDLPVNKLAYYKTYSIEYIRKISKGF